MPTSSVHDPEVLAATTPMAAPMAFHMAPGVNGSTSYPWVGPGCRPLLGVEPSEIMANSGLFWSLVHPNDRTTLKLAKLKAIRHEVAFRERCRITTGSGEVKLIEIFGYPLPSPIHRLSKLWSLQAVDVSIQQRMIDEIRLLKESLSQQENQIKFQSKSLGEAHAAILRLSTKDTLTGVANRLSLEHILWREVAVAQRHGRPLALLLIKVKGLRDLNRVQGVLAGDQALTRFATVLSSCLETNHSVGRLSGVSFCVLLPEADQNIINLFLQRLNSSINGDHLLQQTGVTIYAGTAFCDVDDTCDTLFQRAEHQIQSADKSLARQT